MRTVWKGAVSFGLVSIGVRMYSATEERDVSFHQVRRSDGSRIRYRRVAEADGDEVPFAEIAKGYPLPSGEIVVLTDEDFADLPLPSVRAVEVLQFVPLDQIDPIYFTKSYYLEPDESALRPYLLLRDTLADSGLVAITKLAIRNREQLATLRVHEGVIVLETMLWPDEVRTPEFGFLNSDLTLRPQEKAMAQALVQSMSGDFDASAYTDEYREALQQVIDAKVAGREVVEAAAEQPTAGTVVDLMAALRASVAAAKRSRGEDVADEEASDASKSDASKSGVSKSDISKSDEEDKADASNGPAQRVS